MTTDTSTSMSTIRLYKAHTPHFADKEASRRPGDGLLHVVRGELRREDQPEATWTDVRTGKTSTYQPDPRFYGDTPCGYPGTLVPYGPIILNRIDERGRLCPECLATLGVGDAGAVGDDEPVPTHVFATPYGAVDITARADGHFALAGRLTIHGVAYVWGWDARITAGRWGYPEGSREWSQLPGWSVSGLRRDRPSYGSNYPTDKGLKTAQAAVLEAAGAYLDSDEARAEVAAARRNEQRGAVRQVAREMDALTARYHEQMAQGRAVLALLVAQARAGGAVTRS